MGFGSSLKKLVKSSLKPTALIGNAVGLPGLGNYLSFKNEEDKEKQKKEAAAAQQQAILEEQNAEEERRRKKQEALNSRITGIASLIGSGNDTLG